MARFNFKKSYHFYMAWFFFAAVDLLIVRDISWLKEQFHGDRFWVNYGLTTLALLPILYLVGRYLLQSRPRKIIAFLILFFPLIVQSTYFEIFKTFVSKYEIGFFFENPILTLQFWFENANYFNFAVLFFLVLLGLKLLASHPFKKSAWALSATIFFLLAVYSLTLASWYSITKFQNSIFAYSAVWIESLKLENVILPVIDRPKIPGTVGRRNGPNIVVVIGEAVAASHMSLYGYQRETTPSLEKYEKNGSLVAFKNAISIGTKTDLSVPYMFVGLQGIDPNGIIYSYPTIFNYAKSAGYHTAFISAQDIKWPKIDRIIVDQDLDYVRSGNDYSPSVRVSKGADDMVVLEKGILPYIKAVKNPFLLVIQMDGSHYPYTDHSPAEYKKFLPEKSENDINAYDNTLVYSDIFLDKLIKAVRRKDTYAWIFFSPDHGQEFGGDDGFFNESYSKNVIHNPLLVLPPYSAFAAIKANENRPVSQADIMATILDLINVKPVKPIDGLSLLEPIDPSRLRICSKYMPTSRNKPTAVLVFADLNYFFIEFDKKSVTLTDGRTIMPYSQLAPSFQMLFNRRLSKSNLE